MLWSDRIGRRIKLRDLHVLQAVLEAGSMSKAANELSVSVPVVSKSIADLEHAVGVRLLDRSPQGIEATIYGRALLNRALAAFDELRQGVNEIEFLADPTAGEIRVGSTVPLAASFVSAVIDRLSKKHRRLTFHLVASQTETLYRALRERTVDFLIVRRWGSMSHDQLAFEPLYDDPYVVAAGVTNRWTRQRRIRLGQLVDELWALPPPDSLVGTFVVEAFKASGLEMPRATVLTFPHEVRNSLLATGRYLTILPSSLLRLPAKHPFIKPLRVELPIIAGPIGIVTWKNRTLSSVSQLFLECTRQIARTVADR
jgi:DNA-binding transcriptional LysR family regulator